MSRPEDEKPPIWARAAPRSRGQRQPLSREQIVKVAISIADLEGLEAVSMRRLARERRSGAMSLYHYFDNRDELLELMGDTVAGEMLVPSLPSGWRAATVAVARQSRAAFLNHPWLLPTLQDVPAATPNLLRHIEQSAQAVMPLADRADPALLNGIVVAVDDYTVGFTMREIASGGLEERDRRFRERFADPNVRYLLESGEFPLLSQFVYGGVDAPPPDFERGLAWLLDGFEAQIRAS
jgi:AcrR family transcriptional regulator